MKKFAQFLEMKLSAEDQQRLQELEINITQVQQAYDTMNKKKFQDFCAHVFGNTGITVDGTKTVMLKQALDFLQSLKTSIVQCNF